MHLNSGLLLRHPGESAYAAARRFACANSALGYATLVGEARRHLPAARGSGREARLSSVCRLAAHVEAAHCQRYGIPLPGYALDPPNPFAASPWGLRIARNCPQCARQLFHSPLYELPWLHRCPLHHCALTDTCPTCQQAWPALNELWLRRCSTCGRRLSQDALIHAVHHLDDWASDPLAPLQRAVDYRHAWAGSYLWPGDDRRVDPYDAAIRSPLSARDPLFPSIISRVDTRFRAFCTTQQIPIEACWRLTFRCTPTSDNGMRYDPTAPPPSWVQRCRQQVAAKIARAIARCAGPTHQLLSPTLPCPQPPRCAFCAAFLLWQLFVERPPLRHSEAIAWTMAQRRWYGAMPPPPQPLPLLTVHPLQGMDRKISHHETHYVLPEVAQRWLYTVDLWTTFIAIFRCVEPPDDHPSGAAPAAFTGSPPPPMRLEELLSPSVAFWKNTTEDDLHVYIPKSLLRPRLATPQAAYWLTVCTAHNAVSPTMSWRHSAATPSEKQRGANSTYPPRATR